MPVTPQHLAAARARPGARQFVEQPLIGAWPRVFGFAFAHGNVLRARDSHRAAQKIYREMRSPVNRQRRQIATRHKTWGRAPVRALRRRLPVAPTIQAPRMETLSGLTCALQF